MPKTLGGLVGWIVSTVVMVLVGTWIINRFPMLKGLTGGSA